jgi:hypothetical protein
MLRSTGKIPRVFLEGSCLARAAIRQQRQTEDRQRYPKRRFGGPVRGSWHHISRVAETALIAAFEEAERAKIREEIHEAARFTDEIVCRYGNPFPESRAMLMPDDEDADNLNDDAA